MWNPLKWLRKPEPAVMPKQQPIQLPRIPFPQGHTLESFRSNKALVEEFRKLQGTELWRHVLAALYNSMPGSYPLRKAVENDTHSSLELGRIQGYHDCLNVLTFLAVANESAEQIEPTYGADPTKYNDDHWNTTGRASASTAE